MVREYMGNTDYRRPFGLCMTMLSTWEIQMTEGLCMTMLSTGIYTKEVLRPGQGSK